MQNPTQSHPGLSRRTMLKLLAAAGVTAGGGYALFEYAPWLNYDQQANQARRLFEQDAAPSAVPVQMREFVRYATLAASGHNTQPWHFAIKANAIEIHPDLTRHLLAVDPSDRELWISLGCALENLLVAARTDGYAAEVTYPDAADFIQVRLTADTAQASPLFNAIPLRQNTRSEYDGQLIKSADLDQVQALGQRWVWGLVGAGVAGAFVVSNVLAQPASPAPQGLALVFDLLWLGVVYGLLDALLLSVLPVYAVWQAFTALGWTGSWPKRLVVGGVAVVASLLVTVVYHWGYPEFRGGQVMAPVLGNGIMSLAYLLTTNPLAALFSHIAMHVTAVVHGLNSAVQLPPHY